MPCCWDQLVTRAGSPAAAVASSPLRLAAGMPTGSTAWALVLLYFVGLSAATCRADRLFGGRSSSPPWWPYPTVPSRSAAAARGGGDTGLLPFQRADRMYFCKGKEVSAVFTTDVLSFSIKNVCCLPTYRKTNSKLNPNPSSWFSPELPEPLSGQLTGDQVLSHFI